VVEHLRRYANCGIRKMIEISDTLSIDEDELRLEFVRASGPGGQNVNKVSSAAQLRFDVRHSPSLPEEVKARLIQLAGKRVTDEGVLVIDARHYRTQEHNRLDAIQRLVALIRKALQPPRVRKKTRPGPAARAARLEDKRRRTSIKRKRQAPERED
jgi:ribosome-associated protein